MTALKQYLIITFNYWSFTITDGALRMLVVLHFHQLGYSALEVAMLFLFYEFFGVVTNLVGGWLGARIGLNKTMNIGLFLQIMALSMLLLPEQYLLIPWVMTAQAVSGIAKDLNKMSAKSAIKSLVDSSHSSKLYRWVAFLTGSKNTLKGVGFFIGGALLTAYSFQGAILIMAIVLSAVWIVSILLLKQDIGKARFKPKFRDIFSKSHSINILSAARLFLFASRDVWFVVALPVFLSQQLNWAHAEVGAFFACWVIGYGIVQAIAPSITHRKNSSNSRSVNNKSLLIFWASVLTLVPAAIALSFDYFDVTWVIIIGLLIFAVAFAINSALHSYLIVHFASDEGVSLDVGFYYMANAMGRLVGTVLSGVVYQFFGLVACISISASFLMVTVLITLALKFEDSNSQDSNSQNSSSTV
ncbi:organoarsenical effux MFS transporter ArsJ [Pleionea mediterranea]|uniref:MFS transporter n=1 Tax=Pleionea mediterranea TaxID=523701 RepID=A0A316FNR1_9GAMM|nr:organoarsenical effux MFS transporter ArsJ [Pleionea mediterranea]PWK49893.1 MFS transporter [Pleionea mediterranea]